MQRGLSERPTVNFDLGMGVPLEALDKQEIDRAHPGYQLLELKFWRAAQLMHQRAAILPGNHHSPRRGLAVPPRIFSRLIDIEGMMRVLERRYGDATRDQFGDQQRHQGRLAASAPPGETKDPHCCPAYSLTSLGRYRPPPQRAARPNAAT